MWPVTTGDNDRQGILPLEIERKFLVNQTPAGLEQYQRTKIAQGYIALSGSDELRIRQRGDTCTLTAKRGTGRTRVEEEITLSEGLFEELWPLTDGLRIYKVRYEIPHDGQTIELDEYDQGLLGLRTAEIEFRSEAEANGFTPPAWLGREVTDDPAYKNRTLAKEGIP
jgi:adenylate cyclase